MLNYETLRSLYLEDLETSVTYDGKKARQRVYNIEAWKQLPTVDLKEYTQPLTLWKDSSDVWCFSDQHFGHNNIINYCNRPFPDTRLMTECMIGNYQKLVKPNDICIWVGDVGFMNDLEINNILSQLNGYKILVIGNHDFHHQKLRNLNFHEVYLLYHLRVEDDDLDLVFTHYPMNNLPPGVINIHGHLHDKETGSNQHINVSVERTNYKPINLKTLIPIAKQYKAIYD